MQRGILCCTLTVLLLLSGCVMSLQPLVSDDEAIFDADLVGVWSQTNGDSTWQFRTEEHGYRVTVTAEQGRSGEFHGLLTELDGHRYLDLKPDLDSVEQLDYYKWHLQPMHSFLRIEVTDDRMELSLMNIQWLHQHLDKNPDAIAVQSANDRIILSASTPKLRDFVAAHADEPEFFMEHVELERTR